MSYFVSFIILIGVLIFVHELGHFLTGKLLGVKVLTFSLGFPPRLLGKRIGETEYVLGAIPLGGYVKFLGEEAGDEISKEELARAFHVQPIWKRLTIVLAGPVMNLVFPLLIYFVVISLQPKILPTTVGMLLPGGPAERAGLLPGDRIAEIDGETVKAFDDIRDTLADRGGRTVKIVFFRDGKRMEKTVAVEKQTELLPLDLKREVGRIGIYSSYSAAVIQVPDMESPAYRCGLRTGDLIVSFDGRPIVRWSDLEKIEPKDPSRVVVHLLRPGKVQAGDGSIHVYKPASVTLDMVGGDTSMRSLGIDSTELFIRGVTPGSVADMVGIRPGDRIVKLNGKEIKLWDQLELTLKMFPEAYHEMTLRRPDGSYLSVRFKLNKQSSMDQLKQPMISYVFGAFNYSVYKDEEMIPTPDPIRRALRGSISETASVMKLTFVGIVRILQGKISSKTLGGPIMIFDIAGKAAKRGTGSFLWIMALISINLGIINLVPIPMLDGGLILLFIFEAVTRKTPGPRFRLVYQYIGLAIIGLLIVFVFKNDIERYWDSIVGFVRHNFLRGG
jgi:regulator of sigma E protease